jgi:hypothetical protein
MKHRIAKLLIRAARRLDPSLRPSVGIGSMTVNVHSVSAGSAARLAAAEARLDAARRAAHRAGTQR